MMSATGFGIPPGEYFEKYILSSHGFLLQYCIMKVTDLSDSGCDMHDCLRLLLNLCRWAGVFPVEGLHRRTTYGLRYNMNSVYVVYHVTTLAGQTVLISCSIHLFFTTDVDLSNATNLLFYTNSFLSMVFLIKLARRWPALVRRASGIEAQVASVRQERNWYTRCGLLTITITALALVEHLLSIAFRINLTMNCSQIYNINSTFTKIYFMSTASHVFEYTAYSVWKVAIYQIVHLQATFLWSIIDVLAICISLYLVLYFQDVNKMIREKREQVRWDVIRVQYSHLIKLVKEVDDNLCLLILLSVFTNLAFICLQTFYLLKSYTSVEHFLYYAFSTVFLFTKATVMFLLASNVHHEASKPLLTLLYVPEAEYTIEVQRFIRQVRYTTNALSGYLFYITRPMLIQAGGTILKYELVLLQELKL